MKKQKEEITGVYIIAEMNNGKFYQAFPSKGIQEGIIHLLTLDQPLKLDPDPIFLAIKGKEEK